MPESLWTTSNPVCPMLFLMYIPRIKFILCIIRHRENKMEESVCRGYEKILISYTRDEHS